MSVSLEEAIQNVCAKSREAVEPILTPQILRTEFVAQVLLLFPSESEDSVLQHLVRLRKRGEKQGGLPKKTK